MDGKEYTLQINNGKNHLHGGEKGFGRVVWKAEPLDMAPAAVIFTYKSPDGDQGYPGNVLASVTYILTNDDELRMQYRATTDKPTIINMTNHTYWNLAGAGKDDVLKQVLTLNADRYLPVDAGLIPLGESKPVKGTPMDFNQPTAIGRESTRFRAVMITAGCSFHKRTKKRGN